MTSESIPRTSFFDDDDVSITFEFKKPENKHQKNFNSEPLISNILLKKSGSDNPLQQGCYTLYNTTLAYYKANPSGQPDAVLDLAHARVQSIPASMTTSYYGFVVTRNGSKYEFYSPDEKTIENWINALKGVCVMTNFHDEYKALKMIGKGSFAKVYLVESKSNGKTFAVKAFTKESVVAANKANAKPCMMNEIDIMRVMDNDNVIRLYEVYETEKSIYLVLELVQGRSLQEILKKGGFKDNEPRVINIMSSLLEALAYLASKGVMHRDLKPDNILVDKCDKIKIVDFGLATFIDVPEYIFKKCGTPGYIAPEVFKYDQKNPATHYDAHCDVFSTGCIMYYMLFGTPFFDGPNASEILKINRRFTIEFAALNNAKQEFKNPSSKIPKEALDLVLQLLEFDHKSRPTASQALNHSYIYSVVSQKMAGFYDFYQNGGASPTVFDKRGSFAQEVLSSQLKSGNLASPQTRFMEKDSLYLDVGRPEITGKIDTITSGSANNSMHLVKGGDSSPVSPSKFAKDAPQNRSFRQASILRTMQQGPESKDGGLIRLEEVKNDQRYSEYSRAKEDYSPGGFNIKLNPNQEADDISHEHPQIKTNGDKTPVGGLERHSTKVTDPTAQRFSLLSNQMQGTHEKGI